MSFRGDDQRRYGQVPPVQYPVGQQQDQAGLGRRPSFNSGDDGAYHRHPQQAAAFMPPIPDNPEDELFLGNQAGANPAFARPAYGSTNQPPSAYQHHYQDTVATSASQYNAQPSYNPQVFTPSSSFQRS